MKIIALYLPQYHSFPENDAWWGKGYTEWTAVKRAVPLYKGHLQPKTPLDGYYDLVHDQPQTFIRQAELARKYGIYGFSIYQYYFKGKMLMEKPMEILLSHPEIPLRYCICWANESWTRAWYGRKEEVLKKQEYGDKEDWRRHFEYCLPFFRDERYIKTGGKPVFQIYRTFDIKRLPEMKALWDSLAREAGFDGIYWIGGNTAGEIDSRRALMDGWYDFEPGYTLKHGLSSGKKLCYNASTFLRQCRNTLPWNKPDERKVLERPIPMRWILNGIASREYEDNEFPGILAQWDNTPRRGYKGLVYKGGGPGLFRSTLVRLAKKMEGREVDFVFLNSWNEWGEGAMIEPSEEQGYAYLEAVKDAMS